MLLSLDDAFDAGGEAITLAGVGDALGKVVTEVLEDRPVLRAGYEAKGRGPSVPAKAAIGKLTPQQRVALAYELKALLILYLSPAIFDPEALATLSPFARKVFEDASRLGLAS